MEIKDNYQRDKTLGNLSFAAGKSKGELKKERKKNVGRGDRTWRFLKIQPKAITLIDDCSMLRSWAIYFRRDLNSKWAAVRGVMKGKRPD